MANVAAADFRGHARTLIERHGPRTRARGRGGGGS